MNLDRTKQRNSLYGFPVVDELLRGIAAAVVARCGDRVLRWSGDEFLIRWEGQELAELPDELWFDVAAVQAPGEDGPITATASIGAARAPTLAEAIRRANEALQRAKQHDGGLEVSHGT